jgi:SMC interacting uncharacterized protein involved in chromosome segregation
MIKKINKIKNYIQRKINTRNVTIEALKVELYDKNEEIKHLRQQIRHQRQQLEKVRALPTAKKKELGLL